ncbi:MAG TPA: hypothetical protein VHM70_25195, partial [Polyangiaceae bacterium]|nr:hypothetical protein [Polyangiaceae bacterium]
MKTALCLSRSLPIAALTRISGGLLLILSVGGCADDASNPRDAGSQLATDAATPRDASQPRDAAAATTTATSADDASLAASDATVESLDRDQDASGAERSNATNDAADAGSAAWCAELNAELDAGTLDFERVGELLGLADDFAKAMARYPSKLDQFTQALQGACTGGPSPAEIRRATILAYMRFWEQDPVVLVCAEAKEPHTQQQMASMFGVPASDIAWLAAYTGLGMEELGRRFARLAEETHLTAKNLHSGLYFEMRYVVRDIVNPPPAQETPQVEELIDISDLVEMAQDPAGTTFGIRQPYDHFHEGGPSFVQSVRVSFAATGEKLHAPVMFVPGGYASLDGSPALNLLDNPEINVVSAAHRFYSEWPEDPEQWRFLTPEQSAADFHHVLEVLRPLLDGAWFSSGVSKDGSESLIHRRYYPDDVVGTIAFMSPLGFQEDPEKGVLSILASAAECPQRVVQERNQMLEGFADLLSGSSPNYCPSQSDPFFLYDSATQFHWSFFTNQDALQSSGACKALTGDAAEPAELQESLLLAGELQQAIVDSGEAIGVAGQFDAWQYEIEAYWGDFTTETADLRSFDARAAMSLPAAQTSSDDADASPSAQGDAGPSAAPWGNAPAYDSSVMSDLRKWIATKGENLVLFYGEYDPWSAWSIDLGEAKNSLMIRIP